MKTLAVDCLQRNFFFFLNNSRHICDDWKITGENDCDRVVSFFSGDGSGEIFSPDATFRELCEACENGQSIVSVCRKCLVIDWKIDGKFVQRNYRSDKIVWHTVEGLYGTGIGDLIGSTGRY